MNEYEKIINEKLKKEVDTYKFQAFYKKKLYPVLDIDFNDETIVILKDNRSWICDFKDIKLIKYTGQRESHNERVYTGDILQCGIDRSCAVE